LPDVTSKINLPGSELAFAPTGMKELIRPESVAIFGASVRESGAGSVALDNLIRSGYEGRIYPINPKYEAIRGLSCYPSLDVVADKVDVALVAVPGESVLSTVDSAGIAGARSCIVFSSGFKETGRIEGREREQSLIQLASKHNMRILGPNCVGLIDFAHKAPLTFGTGAWELVQRNGSPVEGLAVVVQSGAIGWYLLHSQTRGVRFSYFVSTGNSAMTDVGDCVDAMIDQPNVSAICLVYEGIRPGSRLLAALERAEVLGIPVVAVKAGQSARGLAAVISHTGAAVGDYKACKAALEARSVYVVDDLTSALEGAQFLSGVRHSTARSQGVAIVSGSGGAGVLSCDAAERTGVELSELSSITLNAIADLVPSYGAVGNPIDVTATDVDGNVLARAVEAVAKDEEVGAVVLALGVAIYTPAVESRISKLLDTARRLDVPLAIVWMSQWNSAESFARFEAADGVSLFLGADSCFGVLHKWLDKGTKSVDDPWQPDMSEAIALLPNRSSILDENESRKILEIAGVPLVPQSYWPVGATMPDWRDYPAVCKVVSPDLAHKAAAGGVSLGIRDDAQLRNETQAMFQRVHQAQPEANITGFLIQEMVSGTQEILIGAVRDAIYGPVVVVGPGGAGAGAEHSVGVAAAPISLARAERLVRATPGVEHLSDEVISQVSNILVRVGALIHQGKTISELEINPLVVTSAGTRVVAVDALIRLATSDASVVITTDEPTLDDEPGMYEQK
jgi:acetate---CoA ligase (ADP-forming)